MIWRVAFHLELSDMAQKFALLKSDSKKKSGRMSLTPLIDCVFILLVFFMLQTNFLKPRAIEFSQSASASKVQSDSPLVSVELREDGSIWLNGSGSSFESLISYAESINQPSQTRVLLAVDPRVKLQAAVDIMDMLNSKSVFNISLAAARRFDDE